MCVCLCARINLWFIFNCKYNANYSTRVAASLVSSLSLFFSLHLCRLLPSRSLISFACCCGFIQKNNLCIYLFMTLGFNHLPRQFSSSVSLFLSLYLFFCLCLCVYVWVCFMAALRLPHCVADFCLSSQRAFNLAIISNFNRLKYLQFYRSAVALRIRLSAPRRTWSSVDCAVAVAIAFAMQIRFGGKGDLFKGPAPRKKQIGIAMQSKVNGCKRV